MTDKEFEKLRRRHAAVTAKEEKRKAQEREWLGKIRQWSVRARITNHSVSGQKYSVWNSIQIRMSPDDSILGPATRPPLGTVWMHNPPQLASTASTPNWGVVQNWSAKEPILGTLNPLVAILQIALGNYLDLDSGSKPWIRIKELVNISSKTSADLWKQSELSQIESCSCLAPDPEETPSSLNDEAFVWLAWGKKPSIMVSQHSQLYDRVIARALAMAKATWPNLIWICSEGGQRAAYLWASKGRTLLRFGADGKSETKAAYSIDDWNFVRNAPLHPRVFKKDSTDASPLAAAVTHCMRQALQSSISSQSTFRT